MENEINKLGRIFNRQNADTEKIVIQRTRVGVVSIACSTGCTLTATSLAWIIANEYEKSTAFVDTAGYMRMAGNEGISEPRGGLFDALGMEKRFALRGYSDLFSLVENGGSLRGISNIDEHINWVLPRKGCGDINAVTQVMIGLNEEYSVYDIGAVCSETELEVILGAMDYIICVADSSPSRLLAGEDRYRLIRQMMLRKGEGNYALAINRANAGTPMREIKSFLGEKKIYELPNLPTDKLLSLEYNCRIPATDRQIRNCFEPLAKTLL